MNEKVYKELIKYLIKEEKTDNAEVAKMIIKTLVKELYRYY